MADARTGPRRVRDKQAAATLAAARAAGYGPDTPVVARDPLMVVLQQDGCYLDEIGDLFGITRETVRARIRLAKPPAP